MVNEDCSRAPSVSGWSTPMANVLIVTNESQFGESIEEDLLPTTVFVVRDHRWLRRMKSRRRRRNNTDRNHIAIIPQFYHSKTLPGLFFFLLLSASPVQIADRLSSAVANWLMKLRGYYFISPVSNQSAVNERMETPLSSCHFEFLGQPDSFLYFLVIF